jgi:hypothetical protein
MANSEATESKPTVPQNPDKTAVAPKSPRAPSRQTGTSVGDVQLDGDTIRAANTIIKNGRVETPDVIIDENGVRRKTPIPPIKPPTAEQWRYMTPEDREKLRMLLKKQMLLQHPIPKATP